MSNIILDNANLQSFDHTSVGVLLIPNRLLYSLNTGRFDVPSFWSWLESCHTSMYVCIYIYAISMWSDSPPVYIHTCLLLLISILWHRQAIFESKGDKLSSSAEGRIRTNQGLRHQIASRLNARWQTDWAIEDQAKNLNSTARPYDQQAFSPLDPRAVWHSHLALAIYMFVVNFDALAQASDIRIEWRQVVFLCWRQDSNPSGSQTPNRQQTECPLTNRLSYRGSS